MSVEREELGELFDVTGDRIRRLESTHPDAFARLQHAVRSNRGRVAKFLDTPGGSESLPDIATIGEMNRFFCD
jgi:hypothetical protein